MSTDRPKHRPSHPSRTEDNACRNHLKQRFSQDAPNLVWVSDFTYIKAGGKWCYLCVVIDLFSRKIVSWQLSDKADTALVMNAFRKAYEKRGRPQGLMFHSDRGTQYTAEPFRKLLDELHVVQSFSKKGYPFDNAVCNGSVKYFSQKSLRGLARTKSASNGGVLRGDLQVLHVHVLLVAPLSTSYMTQSGTD